MATALENLEAARLAITAAIAANPTAVSYSIEGQQVSHGEMIAKLEALNRAIAAFQGPVEVVTYGV